MREVWFVPPDNKNKAEQAVKGDDTVGRASITIKGAASLDIEEDGYFLIIDGSEEVINKANELLKGMAEKYDDREKVLKKVDEQEDSAISGLGSILGE